jgi:hypothetical protein
VLFAAKGLDCSVIYNSLDRETLQTMIERPGRRALSQILIDGQAAGGYQQRASLDSRGEFDQVFM